MNFLSVAKIAGIICLIAGLLFFLDFTLIGWTMRNNPQLREYSYVNLARLFLWVITSIGLIFAPIGLLVLGVTGKGWKRNLGIIGAMLICFGATSYIVGSIYIYKFPENGTRQIFTPLGSLLLTVGILKIAIATYFTGVWSGWRKFLVFLVALYFPLQFPLQAIFFLGQNRGPNPILLGIWGLCWAFLGLTIWSSAVDINFLKLRQQRV